MSKNLRILEDLYLEETDLLDELDALEVELEALSEEDESREDVEQEYHSAVRRLEQVQRLIRNEEEVDCPACHGTGEGMHEGQSCRVCRGRGY